MAPAIEFYRRLGRRLRLLREQARLTQETVAERAGTSHSAISRYEAGQQGMTIEVLRALAAVLNVPPYEVLNFDAEPPEVQMRQTVDEPAPKLSREQRQLLRYWEQMRPRDRRLAITLVRDLWREGKRSRKSAKDEPAT